jgi:hypothetical protein
VSGRRRGGWLLAGGLAGLALSSPPARRLAMGIRVRAARLAPAAGRDPVGPFREAPCYEHDRAEAAARSERTGAAP